MMRITAGAGKPESIVHQAANLVENFTSAAESNANGINPYFPTAEAMRQIFELPNASVEQRVVDSIVRASLRIAASRMLDQPIQVRAAERELVEAIALFRSA